MKGQTIGGPLEWFLDPFHGETSEEVPEVPEVTLRVVLPRNPIDREEKRSWGSMDCRSSVWSGSDFVFFMEMIRAFARTPSEESL
jgi:hypothetical protein